MTVGEDLITAAQNGQSSIPLPGDPVVGPQVVPGGIVIIRDVEKVPERLRRPVKVAMGAMLVHKDLFNDAKFADSSREDVDLSDVPGDILQIMDGMNDAAAIALIESWTFEQPVTAEGLLDIPGDAYTAIVRLVEPLVGKMFPDFGVSPDPKATPGD